MSWGYDRRGVRGYLDEGSWVARRVIWRVAGLLVLAGVIGFGVYLLLAPAGVVNKVINSDNIVGSYEEFQSIYNACQKINTDMGMIRGLPDSDKMFESFSKNAMLAAKAQQMSRWVEEYNAKSRMVTRGYWKSPSLPYQLNVNDFGNYGGRR